MNFKKMPKILILFVFIFVLCFGGERAHALESVGVELPVIANGADCTAELYNKSGQLLQTLELKDGQVDRFNFICGSIDNYDYTLKLSDSDTEEITFDKRVYNVRVHVYYDSLNKISYVISANDESIVLGDADQGKPDKLEFVNVKKGTEYKVCKADPPVKKVIRGGDPLKKSVFDFVMKPLDKNNPMPEGSENGIKMVHITGEGDNEFGYITFNKPGTYEYTAEEIDGGIAGYTYDKRIYTFRYVVSEEGNNLICRTTILVDGTEVDGITVATFVNTYKSSLIEKIGGPKTGDDQAVLILASVAGIALVGLCAVGLYVFVSRKKKKKKD